MESKEALQMLIFNAAGLQIQPSSRAESSGAGSGIGERYTFLFGRKLLDAARMLFGVAVVADAYQQQVFRILGNLCRIFHAPDLRDGRICILIVF